MDVLADDHLIRDEAALEALYGAPSAAAMAKEVDHIHPHYRAMIELSPFGSRSVASRPCREAASP